MDEPMEVVILDLDVWVRVGGTSYALTRPGVGRGPLPVPVRDKVVIKALLEAALARVETYEVE